LAEKYLAALSAISRGKTELAFFHKNTIPTIFTFENGLAVTAILIKPTTKYKVASLVVGSIVAIRTIHVFCLIRRCPRYHF